jgi:hypothetical protein
MNARAAYTQKLWWWDFNRMPRPRIPARNDLKNTPLVFVGMVAVAVAVSVSFLYLVAWLVA